MTNVIYQLLPVSDVTAHLQPFLNPGSTPRTTRPRIGGDSNNFFKLEAKTSTLAFSAVFVSSDLKYSKMLILKLFKIQMCIHFRE